MKFNVREFLDKYRDASIPEYIYEECRELSIKHPSCIIEIPDNIIDAIEEAREKAIFERKNISMCATLNHEGMAHEKAGEIDLAIRAYERNIEGDCIPATHSFDRLMILYRRQKDYDSEIRVIQKAIDVFTRENESRARWAIANNPSKTSEIKKGLETCKPVYGDMHNSAGVLMYCFVPYDVNKYKKRLEKAKFLKQKNIAKQPRNDIEIERDIKIMDVGKDWRQAAEERNIAYMTAEYENWQTLDFVVGFAILRSNRKPRCECNICERLKGDYPKEFKFIGWHPECHCYTVPILMDGETFNENQRRKLRAALRGEEYKKLEAKNAITDVPENFKRWVREHRDLCSATSECDTTPDFIKDNREIIDRILKEQERKKFPFLGIFARFWKFLVHFGRKIEQLKIIKMRTLLVLLSIFCAYSCAFEPMKVQKYANLEQCRLDSIITHYHKAQENQHNKLALDEMFEQYHEELKAFFDENPEVKDWEAVLQGLKSSDTNLNGETYKRITFDLININRQESTPKTTFNAAYWVKIDSLQTDSVYQKLKSIGNIQKVKFSGVILRKEDGSVLTVYKSLGTSHLMTYPSFNILITDISKQQ